MFERRFKDLKFQRFLFCFCFAFGENFESRICMLFRSRWNNHKWMVSWYLLNNLLTKPSNTSEFCSVHQYPRGTTVFLRVYSKMLKKKKILNTNLKTTPESHFMMGTGKIVERCSSHPCSHTSLNWTVIGKSTYHNKYYSHLIL